MISASGKFTPAASTATTTSPAAGTGGATSSTVSVSGRPWVLQSSARIGKADGKGAPTIHQFDVLLYHRPFTRSPSMDLNPGPEDRAFREEVRAFLQANLPADIRDKMLQQKKLTKEDTV